MPHLSKESLARAGCEAVNATVSAPFRCERDVRLNNVGVFPNVTIGRHSYINSGMIRRYTTIGRYCSMGRNLTISAGDHPIEALTTHPIAWRTEAGIQRPPDSRRRPKRRQTEIGNDVWIGDNVVVMHGVSIGTGAVLGANCVVTKDVEPYTIVGGVPARPIRKRFDAETISALLSSEWWTVPYEGLLTLNMNDVHDCLERFPDLRHLYGTDEPSFTDVLR